MSSRRLPLAILLLSGFIDYMGIAIVYPLLAYLLFDPSFTFLPLEASSSVRGLWLGILIALHPLFQFFFSPIFGSLSDLRGRKKLLLITFWIGLASYGIAMMSVLYQSLYLFALYRILSGIACGNCSIVSAVVADISTPQKKAKHFGLLNMAYGAGFTIGPFISGTLAEQVGAIAPFAIAFLLVAVNLYLVYYKLDETHPVFTKGKVKIFSAIYQVKQACRMPELRFIFLGLLIFSLGWSFFTEFVPLYLIDRYNFNPAEVGLFYGYTSLFYSLSAGFLIYPIIRRVGAQRTLFLSMLFSGLYLWLFVSVKSAQFLWFYLPPTQFFFAFVYPLVASEISNRASNERQGEAMGIYQSLTALALTVTPFFSGSFVGSNPSLTVTVSAALMAVSAGAILLQREASAYDTN